MALVADHPRLPQRRRPRPSPVTLRPLLKCRQYLTTELRCLACGQRGSMAFICSATLRGGKFLWQTNVNALAKQTRRNVGTGLGPSLSSASISSTTVSSGCRSRKQVEYLGPLEKPPGLRGWLLLRALHRESLPHPPSVSRGLLHLHLH